MPEAPSRCSTCGVELVGAVRAAPGVDAQLWLTLFEKLRAAITARDSERVGDCYSSDFRQSSFQAGLRYEVFGRAEQVARWVDIYDRDADYLVEISAVRGRWCVFRYHAFGPGDDDIGPWENGRVILAEMDDDGRWRRGEIYSEPDVERARARLDEVVAGDQDKTR